MSSLFKNICYVLHGIENHHAAKSKEHECKTGTLMSVLGKSYGLSKAACEKLNEIGSIHDIGKIAIPETILEKPGPLTQYERKVVELHPVIGHEFIKDIEHPDVNLARAIILTHHENFDGTGYPNKLSGDEIPLEGRICAICDVYDALREDRPYRARTTHEVVLNMMHDTSARGLYHKFDPHLMKLFSNLADVVQAIYDKY